MGNQINNSKKGNNLQRILKLKQHKSYIYNSITF